MKTFKNFINEKTKVLGYLKTGDWFVYKGKNYQLYKNDGGMKVYVKDESGNINTMPSDWKVEIE